MKEILIDSRRHVKEIVELNKDLTAKVRFLEADAYGNFHSKASHLGNWELNNDTVFLYYSFTLEDSVREAKRKFFFDEYTGYLYDTDTISDLTFYLVKQQ